MAEPFSKRNDDPRALPTTPGDAADEVRAQRRRLAQLIGRVLARDWLRDRCAASIREEHAASEDSLEDGLPKMP